MDCYTFIMSHWGAKGSNYPSPFCSMTSELAGKDDELQAQQQQLAERADKIVKMREKRQELKKTHNIETMELESQVKTLEEENKELRKEVEWLKVAHAKGTLIKMLK